jgi:hypothetical protein
MDSSASFGDLIRALRHLLRLFELPLPLLQQRSSSSSVVRDRIAKSGHNLHSLRGL